MGRQLQRSSWPPIAELEYRQEIFFPGTKDRILLIGGTILSVVACITDVIRRIHEVFVHDGGQLMVKLLVPNSSVSHLIGHGGDVAKRLTVTTGCQFSISRRVEGIQERIAFLCGEYNNLVQAVVYVVFDIQRDSNLKEHAHFNYDPELDLHPGVWNSSHSTRSNKSQDYSKHDSLMCMRKAAMRDVMLRCNISGHANNIFMAINELLAAMCEIWSVRYSETQGLQELQEEDKTVGLSLVSLPAKEEEEMDEPRPYINLYTTCCDNEFNDRGNSTTDSSRNDGLHNSCPSMFCGMFHCWPKDATEAHSQETLQFPVLMQQQPDSPGDAFGGLLSLPWSTAKTAATHVLGSTPEMAHRL